MRFATLAVALLFAACASSPEAPPAPAEDQGPIVGPPETAWKDMTKKQKGRYMKEVVMPKMGPVFASFDKFHGDLKCKTCHGEEAKEREFEMPAPSLDELPAPTDKAGWDELMADEAEWVKFMGEQVKPQMAQLLGLPEFNPAAPDPTAFGCYNCHPHPAPAAQ